MHPLPLASIVRKRAAWKADGETFWRQTADVTTMLDGLVAEEASDG